MRLAAFLPPIGVRWHALRGFTLIELLVVVAIVAILAAIAAPNFADLLSRTRSADAAASLQLALSTARAEALRRGTAVSVCRSTDATATAPSCATSANADWTSGWLIFVDTDADGALDSGETLLVRQGALNTGSGRRAIATGSVASVTYAADGLRAPMVTPAAARFYVRDDDGTGTKESAKRCLTVLVTGQASVADGSCSSPTGTG